MSYRIISTEKLYGDHFSRLESGVTVLARVSCAFGVTPQEAALKQVTPYGDTKVALIAYHDGSGEGSAVIDDFDLQGQRLARAIKDIDSRLDWIHRHNQPVPLDAYRARRILHAALVRCRERNAILPPAR